MSKAVNRWDASAILLFAGLSLWVCTYAAQTWFTALRPPPEPLDLFRIKRAFLTFLGAAAYCALLMKLPASALATAPQRIAVLLLATLGTGLFLWALRVAMDASHAGDPLNPIEDARWVLVWSLFFLVWLFTGIALMQGIAAPGTNFKGQERQWTMLLRVARQPLAQQPTAALSDDERRSQPALQEAKARRIAFILSGLEAGGSERVANTLANLWAERGSQVSVVSFDAVSAASYYDYSKRVSIHRLALPPRRMSKPRAAWEFARRVLALRRVLLEIEPGVIVSFLTRPNVVTLIATRGSGIPVIVSERSNPELQNPGRVWNWLRLRLYPQAFALVTMTSGARDFFPPKIRAITCIVPNPVSLPTNWRDRCGTKTVTAVGRLQSVKGFDVLIKAFGEIASKHPDWKLVIWGEGPERTALERLRGELGLEQSVELPGLTAVPGGWAETAEVFVLSSRYEGWPNALAEAMSWGLPVVSSRCAWGPANMITDGQDGLLVPPDDVSALGNALSRLLGDPQLRLKLGNAARTSATRFSSEKMFQKWDDLVSEAIANPTQSPPSSVSTKR